MGLFHDVCKKCGNKVSKKARFCPKCGHGAPDGWIRCPQCGKWVGNDSEYCPSCNHPLHPTERVNLAGGVWDRKSEHFAQRFELDDVRFIRENGLMVQEGTVAVLLDGGKKAAVLGPGRHHPTGTLRSINWFGNPPPRSAVMVDSGDVVFRIDFDGKPGDANDSARAPLRTAEELQVGAVAEVTLRFVPGKADDFIANFMKEVRVVTAKDVCRWLYEESLSAVRDLCQQSTVEDLVKDPDRRERFEDVIARALKASFQRIGLELVRVGAVEFYGAAYEEVRAKYGELEKARRLVEFQKKQLELLATEESQRQADTKDKAKRAQETQDYLDQLAQEKQLAEIDRTAELQIAVRVAKGDLDRKEAELAAARELEKHAAEMTALAHKLDLDLTLKNYDREQLVADAENKARLSEIARAESVKDVQRDTVLKGEALNQAKIDDEIERIKKNREIWETREYIRLAHERDEQELDRKRREAEIRVAERKGMVEAVKGLSTAEMVASGADAATQKNLVDLALGTAKIAADRDVGLAKAQETASAAVLAKTEEKNRERLAHDEKLEDRLFSLTEKAVERQTTVVPPATVNNFQH